MKKLLSTTAILCIIAGGISSCSNRPSDHAATDDNNAWAIAAEGNPRIPDWAYTHRYAEQRDTSAARPKVILYGDSITEGWWIDKDFFLSRGWYERGIGGMTSAQLLVRLRTDVLNARPEYVVILCGINDIAQNNGPVDLQVTLGNIISMAELARYNGIRPVLCTLTPCTRFYWRPEFGDPSLKVIAFNEKLRAYCEKAGIICLDYHKALLDAVASEGRSNGLALPEDYSHDGCHLTLKSYRILEELVVEAVK